MSGDRIERPARPGGKGAVVPLPAKGAGSGSATPPPRPSQALNIFALRVPGLGAHPFCHYSQ